VDSRVFWSASVRDMLFDVSFGLSILSGPCTVAELSLAAIETLLSRLETLKDEAFANHGYSMELLTRLVQAIARCQG